MKAKSRKPEIGKAPCFSSHHRGYVFLLRLFLEGRTPALPSPLYRSKSVIQYLSDFWCKGTAFF